jgi:hypothetical protein
LSNKTSNIGSIFSDLLLNHSETQFSTTYLMLTKKGLNHGSIIVRYFSIKSVANIVFGRTAMTSTGRAAIRVAVITGSGYLASQYLREQHEACENAKDRESTEKIAYETNRLKRIELTIKNPTQADVIFEGHPNALAKFKDTLTPKSF